MTQAVGIVGGGILGLAHAWSAWERGHQVVVFERAPRAEGASVRNFGMIWPIGQLGGPQSDAASLSRERWLAAAEQANCWLSPCGSLHLAHHDDEMAVLREFAHSDLNRSLCSTLATEVLTRRQVLDRAPGANPAGLLGGLWSPSEMGVNPRQACAALTSGLEKAGVRFRFDTTIAEIDLGGSDQRNSAIALSDSRGERSEFQSVFICAGADFRTLLPEVFDQSGLRPCKLQMMRTRSQPDQWRIGPHLASGLTLRHYNNFQICPSLRAVKQRIARDNPELDRFGIHVMASQDDQGRVILGDSHEYGADITPFDKQEIDDLMLRELRKVFHLPDWILDQKWHGIYAKCDEPVFQREPLPNVHVCTGVGGAGMTLSFGIAEQKWRELDAR